MQKKKKDNAPIDPVILATIASKESRGGRKLQERDKKKRSLKGRGPEARHPDRREEAYRGQDVRTATIGLT